MYISGGGGSQINISLPEMSDNEWDVIAAFLAGQREFADPSQQSMDYIGHFVFGQTVEIATGTGAAPVTAAGDE